MINFLQRIILLVMLVITGCLSHAQENNRVVELNDNTPVYLKDYMFYWLPDQPVDFATARSAAENNLYQPVTTNRAPASGRDIWYRFQIKPGASWSYRTILDLNDILYEDAEIFVETPEGSSRFLTGLNHPYATRPISYRFIAVHLTAPGDVISTVYIRIRPLTGIQTSFSPVVMTDQSFFGDSSRESEVAAAVSGGMAVVLIFMFFVSNLILRGRTQFVFLGFAAAILLLNLCHSGFLSQWLDLDIPTYRLLFIMMPAIMNVLSLYYCRYLFDMTATMPLLNKLIQPFSIIYMVLMLVIALAPAEWLNANLIFAKATASGFASLLVLVFGLRALQARIKGSGYYILGVLLYVLIINITRLPSYGFGSLSADSRNMVSIGGLALMLCFAMATLQKIRQIIEREKQLEKQSAVLENQNRIRTDFLISMSHEIRTPINGVLGMTQMLEKTRLDSAQRYYLEVLSNAGRTLLNVVNEILDLSKLEAGKLEIESIYFVLDLSLNYTIEMFSQINRKSGVTFTFESDPDIPVHLVGDPARLQQLLNNLLSNAFKFTEKGQVSLSIKLIDRISADRIILRFEVKDSGIGISEEALTRLFNPFEQADSTTSRRFGGTGLGLAICKKIVELMGGQIHVASVIGEGSRFWADIPFNIAQREEQRFTNITNALKGTRIGMLIQHPEYNEILISILKQWGMSTTLLKPDQFPDSTNLNDIDLLYISDMLPKNTLSQWLKKTEEKNCPVLIVDGYGEKYNPSQILESTTIRRLHQPLSKSLLAEMLYQLIHRISPTSVDSSTKFHASNLIDLNLLVAEDNDVNTKVLKAVFEKNRIRAEFFTNGAEALACYKEKPNRFDAVLMDCEMPVMNGFEATTQIRQFEKDNQLPPVTIIALTAHALLETREACLQCGMDDILTKPVSFPALLSRLESLERNRNPD